LPGGKPVKSITVGAFLGESQVADDLAEIQTRFPDIDLGSYPFYRPSGYGTNLVMRGTEPEDLDAMAKAVTEMIQRFDAIAYPGGAPDQPDT
jgi:molybdopterin-biosynthesis enzyme MoeA-like protein